MSAELNLQSVFTTKPASSSPTPSLAGYYGIAVILVGAAVLLGWVADYAPLKRFLFGMGSMHPLTAVSFILFGCSLLAAPETKGRSRRAAGFCAGVMTAIALWKVITLFVWGGFSPEAVIFGGPLWEPDIRALNRMASSTAFGMLALGIARLVLFARTTRAVYAAQILASAVGLQAVLLLVSYFYGAWSSSASVTAVTFAPHTGLTFLLAVIGLLSYRRREGVTAAFGEEGTAGLVARRLIPASVAIPFLLGLVTLEGQRRDAFSAEMGVSLHVTAVIVVFVALVSWCAYVLARLDRERSAAVAALRLSDERQKVLFAHIPQEVFFKGRDLSFVSVNPAFAAQYGRRPEEMVGKSDFDLFPPEVADKYRADDERVMTTGCIEVIEEFHEVGGRRRTVEAIKAPVVSGTGREPAA
jgi:PAS domain S-box-containing protein